MPRRSRIVFAGLPHHVTQRGNRRGRVFFTAADRHCYLRWLSDYGERYRVSVLAYCLMTNHVHFVLVPEECDGLERLMQALHARYAQHVNRTRDWNGHLWQGRYFSSALDSEYLLRTIRYVERNPLRAGMIARAEAYPWSSAAAHCGLREDPVLVRSNDPLRTLPTVVNWSAWLAVSDDPDCRDTLRRNGSQNLPCGSPEFIAALERTSGRNLSYRAPGREKDAS